MDLRTQYLGFDLPHPFMPGASPLVDDLDIVRRLEDAGASAIVMHSLFEEQIRAEQLATHHHLETPSQSFAEALTYLPEPPSFALGPHEYLEQVRRVRETVSVPVIASLNGTTPGGWLDYARLLVDAGAHALELNLYGLVTDPEQTSQTIEERILWVVREVTASVNVPVAVKLTPFFTALPRLVRDLIDAGARGVVLFNRFFEPDIDPEELEVRPTLRLSNSSEVLLRVHWLAILSGRLPTSFAASGGVNTVEDAVKVIMAGADAVQLVSALLRNSPEYLATLREETSRWMEEHGYESLAQMRGCMNLLRCPDPQAFERTNYMRVLQSWKGFL